MNHLQRLTACLFFTFSASPALSHSWYSPWCCNDKDCIAAPVGSVIWSPDGWVITLEPGEHPQVPAGGVFVLPEGSVMWGNQQIRASKDQRFHACILNPAEAEPYVRCLYVPEGGA